MLAWVPSCENTSDLSLASIGWPTAVYTTSTKRLSSHSPTSSPFQEWLVALSSHRLEVFSLVSSCRRCCLLGSRYAPCLFLPVREGGRALSLSLGWDESALSLASRLLVSPCCLSSPSARATERASERPKGRGVASPRRSHTGREDLRQSIHLSLGALWLGSPPARLSWRRAQAGGAYRANHTQSADFFPPQPQEIKDIKKFLEIARRPDARCTSAWLLLSSSMLTARLPDAYSRDDQEVDLAQAGRLGRDDEPDQVQVQGPMLALPVHVCHLGRRQGCQAQAITAP